jgi:hypothetical protein
MTRAELVQTVQALHDTLAERLQAGNVQPEDASLLVDLSVWLKRQARGPDGHSFGDTSLSGRTCLRCGVIEHTDILTGQKTYVDFDPQTARWRLYDTAPDCLKYEVAP